MLVDCHRHHTCFRNTFPASQPVHGFRSAIKVWCAEVAKVRDEVSEAALAHAIPQKVRAAYLRTDFFGERRELMEWWSAFDASARTPPARFRGDGRTSA
jgi:hypothetical protein